MPQGQARMFAWSIETQKADKAQKFLASFCQECFVIERGGAGIRPAPLIL